MATCSRWIRVGLHVRGSAPGGIFSSTCHHLGREHKLQILCSTRPGQGCHGYAWPNDPTDRLALIGPIEGRDFRSVAVDLRKSLARWAQQRRRKGVSW